MVAMRDSSATALAVGRLTGCEPLGFEAGDNNWYRFVANGPTGKTDPSGSDWLDSYTNWFNGVFGAGYSQTMGGYLHSGLNNAGISDTSLANTSANQALVGTAIVAVPVGVGLFGGGEILLGLGTLGAVGPQVTAGAYVTVGTAVSHPLAAPVALGLAEAAAGIEGPGLGIDDGVRLGTIAISRCPAVPFRPNSLTHIFRPHHNLVDSTATRRMLQEIAGDVANLAGINQHGTQVYTRLLDDGSQMWVYVRDGVIFDAGRNVTPKKLP